MNSAGNAGTSEAGVLDAIVETLTLRKATGWVAGPAEQFPVRVEMCLNDLVVMTTWADHPSTVAAHDHVRGFQFAIRDLWSYASASDQVSFRIDGRPVPIAEKGMFKQRSRDGEFTVDDLQDKFAAGFVFDRAGRLRLSKKHDAQWQSQVIALYDRVAEVVTASTGHDTFVFYGSLLGQVRENGFIGHDDDFDAAYVSDHSDGPAAARELRDVAFALVEAGLDVECKLSALHIHDASDSSLRIDLFHTYFDDKGNLTLPFGRAGEREFKREQWQGVVKGEMAGHKVMVPASAEELVAHLYGDNWRVPQAGFSWSHARTTRDRTGFVAPADREAVYWTNFYARHEFTSGSTFFDKVKSRSDIPSTVLDIGCGDGRDSFAFATAGRRVVGLDRSQVGVEHASKRAERAGLAHLSFEACDVTDDAGVRRIIAKARSEAGGGAILFYLRFFLHSIPEDVQEKLMQTLADCAEQGDFLAAEFRTDKDEANHKTYGKHYRRFQNGPAFGHSLSRRWGFSVLDEQEGTGLSVYKEEDPALYRVIARKGGSRSSVAHQARQVVRRAASSGRSRLLKALG